jgi:L-asparaginase/Glu-tRNA(Gln) amidotransferase subunit D
MPKKNKKIYFIVASDIPGITERNLFKEMPELEILASTEPLFVFEKNSVDTTPRIWEKLAGTIQEHISKADGFVVLHGIDNLLYTAASVSFLLQNLPKPVIFTGGQITQGKDIKADIRANIINAVQAASFDFGEVALMFGNRLLRANQAEWATDKSLNVFSAPLEGTLGRIDFSIRIFEKTVMKPAAKPKFFKKLEDSIAIVKVAPTLNLKDLTQQLAGKRGVIIKAGKYQELPKDLMFLLEKLAADLPVVVKSFITRSSSRKKCCFIRQYDLGSHFDQIHVGAEPVRRYKESKRAAE